MSPIPAPQQQQKPAVATQVEAADFAGLSLQRFGCYGVGGPRKGISLGLCNRFVDQTPPALHKASGEQEPAPLPPQSSELKLEQPGAP